MPPKQILDYEPLPPRGLRRKTVISLVGGSVGLAILVSGVTYGLGGSRPRAPIQMAQPPGGLVPLPATMPWKTRSATKPATWPTAPMGIETLEEQTDGQ